MSKPRQYHNLDGWCRDAQAALRDGGERAYLLAELLLDILDLVDADAERSSPADELAGGAGDGEDGMLDTDGSVGAGPSPAHPGLGDEDVDADSPRVVRVPDRESGQVHLPLGGAGGAGSGPAKRRTAVLTDAELVEELAVRNLTSGGKVRLTNATRT